MHHFQESLAARGGAIWQTRHEAAGLLRAVLHADDPESMGEMLAFGEEQARSCLAYLEDHRPDTAEARAAEIEVHWLISRVLALPARGGSSRREAEECEEHFDLCAELVRSWLEPATARLPRCPPAAPLHAGSVRTERLAQYPALWRVSGLLSDAECEWLKARAAPLMRQSEIASRTATTHHGYRSSSTAWVPTRDDEQLVALTRRVAALVQMPVEHLLDGAAGDAGRVQVVRYAPSQQYGVHHDCNGLYRRFATVLYYLSDVEGGGETAFPYAGDAEDEWADIDTIDKACAHAAAPEHADLMSQRLLGLPASRDERPALPGRPLRPSAPAAGIVAAAAPAKRTGVVVAPRKGDAVLWYNYDSSGRPDPRAVHAALPVVSGEKWAANHWVSRTPKELLSC